MARTILIHEWVTGGGLAGAELPRALADAGAAMRRSLAHDFHHVDGVEVVMTLDRRFAERHPFRVVPIGAGEEPATLDRLAAECDDTLVIAPETGGILADRLARVERVGGHSLGSTVAAVKLAGDKVGLAAFLEARGVPTIPTRAVRVASGAPMDAVFPAVLKPIDGAGSTQTFLLQRPDDWPGGEDLPELMALQPFIPGVALSATYLIGASARLLAVGRQTIGLRDGMITYEGGTLPLPAHFADGPPWQAVRAVEGLRGLVGVDFLRAAESGASLVVEINPRPTMPVVGLVRLLGTGVLARAWLESDTTSTHSVILPGDRASVVVFGHDGSVTMKEDHL